MPYAATDKWSDHYQGNQEFSYPAEGVIRILKGEFPDLRMSRPEKGQSVLDLGCGDGRHFSLFYNLGLKISGTEITQEIVDGLASQFSELEIPIDLRAGTTNSIPFKSSIFDYLLAWNSCYYMSAGNCTFADHVTEMARVIRPGGFLICSIPKSSNFIFRDSVAASPGYNLVSDDYFGLRNGEMMRCFSSAEEVITEFEREFENISFASIEMEWFGLAYHWHVFTAQRRV